MASCREPERRGRSKPEVANRIMSDRQAAGSVQALSHPRTFAKRVRPLEEMARTHRSSLAESARSSRRLAGTTLAPARLTLLARGPSNMAISGRTSDPWAIVLAGGDGVRLRAVTEWLTGEPRPKQFCSLISERSLLDDTIRRAALSAAPDHHLVVLTQSHEAYWSSLRASTLASSRLLIQPDNRGTAVALLLAFQTLDSL